MSEISCVKIQEKILNSAACGKTLDEDIRGHLVDCPECSTYAEILNVISANYIPAELTDSTLSHCHTLLTLPRKRIKTARIRKWSICAGIAAMFIALLSLTMPANVLKNQKDAFILAEGYLAELSEETELELAAENTDAINIELDVFVCETY